jgi:hypothetical protein
MVTTVIIGFGSAEDMANWRNGHVVDTATSPEELQEKTYKTTFQYLRFCQEVTREEAMTIQVVAVANERYRTKNPGF